MEELLRDARLILMEAAVVERLRRSPGVALHPSLVNAPLIYEQAGREALAAIYAEYLSIAAAADLPILLCTPTWRAGESRVAEAKADPKINRDAADFLRHLRDCAAPRAAVRIGGLIGCANDCYAPGEGLPAAEAESRHAWQVDQLALGGVDFLLAATLPAVAEAIGIARAMERTGLPYLISFVIDRNGRVLDGTPLRAAVERIDASPGRRPLGFMVNCAYPTFLRAAEQPAALFERLIGFQANASALDHCELDNADRLQAEPIPEWGELMLALNESRGMKILGGCCGTTAEHLRYLAEARR